MTTLVDDAGTDDEEERASTAAFFHELERRHGGPLSYEELQEFELSLKSEDSDSDDDEDVPPCTFGAPSSGVAAPPAAATPSCDETPGCGWMTPATPRHGKAAAAASPGASTAAGQRRRRRGHRGRWQPLRLASREPGRLPPRGPRLPGRPVDRGRGAAPDGGGRITQARAGARGRRAALAQRPPGRVGLQRHLQPDWSR